MLVNATPIKIVVLYLLYLQGQLVFKVLSSIYMYGRCTSFCGSSRNHGKYREPSGSMVECLTGDRGDAGLSLTDLAALCP